MRYIAEYDSAAFMHRAVANFLHGKDFDVAASIPPHIPKPLFISALRALNQLPESLKIKLSVSTSTTQAIQPRDVATFDSDRAAEALVSKFPRRQYPVIAIGSSNGALVHLYAALGIPWLPQTNLMLINRDVPIEPDDMAHDAKWGEEFARPLLENNP